MDKFELKEKLINITDQLDKMVGDLMSNGCKDVETGEIRSEVYTQLLKTNEFLKSKIYNIY